MKSDDRDFSDAIDAGVWPWPRGKIGYGPNVQVITERGLGSLSRLSWLAGKSEDDFVDEFGASEPVQISDSPQYRRGKRQVVIHEAADGCAMKRIVAPGPHKLPQPARQREPGQAAGKYSHCGERAHSIPRSDEYQADREQR